MKAHVGRCAAVGGTHGGKLVPACPCHFVCEQVSTA